MTIAEVSKQFHLTQDTLRYYERIGLLPPVKRDQRQRRDYQDEDCKWISFITCMRSAGLPIEVLIEYVNLFQQGDHTIPARKALLEEQREHLIEKIEALQNTLCRLDGKIDQYEQKVIIKEKELSMR